MKYYLILFLMFFINSLITIFVYSLFIFVYKKIKNHLHKRKIEKFIKQTQKIKGKVLVEFVDDKNIFGGKNDRI